MSALRLLARQIVEWDSAIHLVSLMKIGYRIGGRNGVRSPVMRTTSGLVRTGFILGLGIFLSAPTAGLGQVPERSPVLTTPHFTFYSDFDTNLNDALIEAGRARKGGKPELFHSGSESTCFEKLPRSGRAAWDRAVDYFAEIVSPAEGQQFLIRMQLAGFNDELKEAADRQFVDLALSFRSAAAPAYRACRWEAQDERNRSWIEKLKFRLVAYEDRVAARLVQLYHKPWSGLPIPVDLVQTVNWSGANTIFLDAGGGHILISEDHESLAALEVVFHEASHLLMGRGDPLRKALEEAAKAADVRIPGDLWHVVLFYVTGEAVRRILEDGGEPGYQPMLNAIYDRGGWIEFRTAIRTAWRPYVDGQRTPAEAAASLIETIRKPVQPKPDGEQPKTSGKP